MFPIVLFLHSFLRWVVLALAVAALVRAIRGVSSKRAYSPADRKTGLFFTIALDTQVLLGLLLYFVLSPTMQIVFSAGMGVAMKDKILRFWAVEHLTSMVLAVVFAHVGSVLVKRAKNDASKHKRALVWFSLAILAMLVGIPWPFLGQHGRPLLTPP